VSACAAVMVVCVACRTEARVRSRSEYSAFDDRHRVVCGTRVVLHRATLDDLLDLPPHYEIDLAGYESGRSLGGPPQRRPDPVTRG
jgi:hypothetical protein